MLAAFQLEKVRVETALRRAGVSEMQEQVNLLFVDLGDAEEAVARETATGLAGVLAQVRVLAENLGHEEEFDQRLCEWIIGGLNAMMGERKRGTDV